jgi:hypothetical protein
MGIAGIPGAASSDDVVRDTRNGTIAKGILPEMIVCDRS